MTRIFISHSHSDQEIAEKLVDFLLSALNLKSEDLRCTSVPGHYLPFGTSIEQQLKKDLTKTTGLIALITQDSLRSTWVLFELGSSWAMDKLVIPILGPGLTYEDLPGPLKDYPVLRIEDDNPDWRLSDVVNQLATTLNLTQEQSSRREAKKAAFLNQLKAWKSTRPNPDINQQKQLEELTAKLEQLGQEKLTIQKEYQEENQRRQEEYLRVVKQLQQSEKQYKSRLQQLDKESKQEKLDLENYHQSALATLQIQLFMLQQKLAEKESIITQLQTPKKTEKPIELKSERGIDYTKLEELLKQQQWKEADRETYVCMITAVGRKEGDYFRKEDIENFPCEDLRTLDQLWVKYSDGRFGLSVQKKIWLDVGGKVDDDTERKLGDRVGWRKGEEWMSYDSLQFDLSAPPGHLPAWFGSFLVSGVGLGWVGSCLFLLSRKEL